MQYYPLFLDISSMRCLVIGAGSVGRRKISTLIKAKIGELLVIDEFLSKNEFIKYYKEEYAEDININYRQGNFSFDDFQNINLVFASTSNSEQNGIIAEYCKRNNILCNVIENVSRGNFIVPSHIQVSNLVLALSTSGTSPALAKALKTDLVNWLGTSYIPFLNVLEEIRTLAFEHFTQTNIRTEIFRKLVQNDLREKFINLLKEDKKEDFKQLLAENLPNIIHEKISWVKVFG